MSWLLPTSLVASSTISASRQLTLFQTRNWTGSYAPLLLWAFAQDIPSAWHVLTPFSAWLPSWHFLCNTIFACPRWNCSRTFHIEFFLDYMSTCLKLVSKGAKFCILCSTWGELRGLLWMSCFIHSQFQTWEVPGVSRVQCFLIFRELTEAPGGEDTLQGPWELKQSKCGHFLSPQPTTWCY